MIKKNSIKSELRKTKKNCKMKLKEKILKKREKQTSLYEPCRPELIFQIHNLLNSRLWTQSIS